MNPKVYVWSGPSPIVVVGSLNKSYIGASGPKLVALGSHPALPNCDICTKLYMAIYMIHDLQASVHALYTVASWHSCTGLVSWCIVVALVYRWLQAMYIAMYSFVQMLYNMGGQGGSQVLPIWGQMPPI